MMICFLAITITVFSIRLPFFSILLSVNADVDIEYILI